MSSSDFVPEAVRIHNYLHLVGVVILYYDFLLTFGEEYWRIWKNRKSISSGLFFLNRYLPILADIAVNVGNFIEFPTELVVILFLRTFALYSRDWRVGGSILGFSMCLLGISVGAIVGQRQEVELKGGCHTAADRITAIRIAVSWESLFLFDLTIFSLTLLKTYRQRRHNPVTTGPNDILSLVMRDGALYFAVMASANLANTITFYVLEPLLRGCLSTAASSISVTMMSRLMLNLHGSAFGRGELITTRFSDGSSSDTTDQSTSLFFTSRISIPPSPIAGPWESVRDRRESAYVRDLHSGLGYYGDGYIEEVYEMQDMHYRGDGERGDPRLRVPLRMEEQRDKEREGRGRGVSAVRFVEEGRQVNDGGSAVNVGR